MFLIDVGQRAQQQIKHYSIRPAAPLIYFFFYFFRKRAALNKTNLKRDKETSNSEVC